MTTFKTRRKRLKVKRQDLATQAGISVSTLWRIEEGKSDPSPLVARALELVLTFLETERKEAV